MKNLITYIFGAMMVLTTALASQNAYGQCANNNTLWASAGAINPGQTITINGTWGGEYNTFSCVSGSTYVISTCNGGTWDSQLTLYNNTGGSSLAYNDDFCGLQSQITWTATYTGTVRVLLDTYPCTSNSTSMTMTITRNSGGGGGGGNCWDGVITNTGSVSSTTCNAGNESSLRTSTDRTYRININSAGCYNFSLCGSASWDSYLYLTTACPGTGGTVGGGTVIATSDDACGLLSQISNVSLTAGTYYLTVEGFGSSDCGSFTLNVTNGAAPVAGAISAPTSFGCGSTTTFSVPFVSGVTYNWSTTNGFISGGQGTSSVSVAWGSGSGTVSVTPSSACGTGAAVSTTVNCTPPPANDNCGNATPFAGSTQSFNNIFATGSDISSCTYNDFNDIWYTWTAPICGQVTFATCGSSFDTHLSLWNSCGSGEIACNDDACGLQSSISANVTAGQTYYLRVAGYNGASGSGTINMTMSTPLAVTVSSSVPNATLCFSNGNAATTLTASITGGTGSVNYQWQYQDNNGNWVNISGLTASGSGAAPLTVSQNASPTSTRNYRVVVSDATNGTCTASAVQLITVIADPVISLISSDVTCFGANDGTAGGSLTGGTAGNSYTFNWSPGSPNGDGTLNVTDLAPGTYTLSASGMYGCNASASVTISEPSELVGSASTGQIACYGETTFAVISATGGTPGYTGVGTITNLSAGSYIYIVEDANGCSAEVKFDITQPDLLVASSTSTEILCFGGESTVTVSAIGGTQGYTGTGDFTVTAGDYNYVVTDANGCVANTDISISQPTQLYADAGEGANVFYGYGPQACVNLTGSGIDGTPGYVYVWSADGMNNTIGSTMNVCPSVSTDYTLTVTDANGCTATDVVSVCVTDVTCQAGNSGIIKVEMCMIPPGNPNNAHTICVDESAVPAHLMIGCQLGACDEYANGCGGLLAAKSLSSETEGSNAALSVYPNPTGSATTVSVTVTNKGTYSVALYDLMGKQLKTIYKGAFEQYENLSFDMNMETLENGIYIVGVSSEDQMISIIKVMKQ